MKTKDIILALRNKAGMSQDELAEKLYVTRQAVSRWENGETIPNTETLKLLSSIFDVSINTLLGSPRKLICQCCGMPMEDDALSKETDGNYNEEYCKWCYSEGEFTYDSMDDLISYCSTHMANESFSSDEVTSYMKKLLPTLNYWKRYESLGGTEKFNEFKQQLMDEFNSLNIEGMPEVKSLNALVGTYVNLEVRLPNGKMMKLLDDHATYLGTQLESVIDENFCFGLVANMEFLMVFTYEAEGENPELIVYKRR